MKAKDYIAKNRQNMIDDLIDLIKIPSVYNSDTATEQMPFGSEVDKGLKWTLNKAESMGMDIKNIDGYAGEVTIGKGNFMIGVLAHEDVVAEGDGWNTPAFEPLIKENSIYGRGSSDDKGAIISCLYALKYLMDEKKIPSHGSIRMIIGTNEEESWEGIDHYVKVCDRLPDYSIVPDGLFPMIFCEKGLLDFDLKIQVNKNENSLKVSKLCGGAGRNIVAGSATCSMSCDEKIAIDITNLLDKKTVPHINYDNGELILKVDGKSAHAMTPEKGKNALSMLFDTLGVLPYNCSIDNAIQKYNKCFGLTYNGEKMGLALEDELSGKLTFNIGQCTLEENALMLKCNIRHPATLDRKYVEDILKKKCKEENIEYTFIDYLPPVYIDPKSNFMKTLLGVYQKITGDIETKPFAIGGATYARSIPNAVAYGPLFPYEEELAHEANEYLSIDSFEKMTLIYINVLEELLNMGAE